MGKPAVTKVYFPKVKEARQILREKATELYEAYYALAKQAAAEGKPEVAEKILWNLIDHMPNEDGERMIDAAASKPKQTEGYQGPTIQIGLALGGMPTQKALPEVTIVNGDIDTDE